MNRSGFGRTARPARVFAWASAVAALAVSFGASAATDVRVWHALPPHNADVFKSQVNDFNRSQSDVRVQLKSFRSVAAIERTIAAAKKLEENRAPGGAARSYAQPLHVLLATHPIKNAKWYLNGDNAFGRDSKGRMLSFPYMAEVPVMFYNIDAFKKAKLKPEPDRSWSGL